MYKITNIYFDYWCKITFENSKGKLFEIECSNDFGEKFITKYIKFKYSNKSYKINVIYEYSNDETYTIEKKFSLLRLYWLKFRGFLSLATENLFI